MSAPDTNIEKQETRHKPALLGIKGAVIFGVVMVLLLLFVILNNGRDDDEAAADLTTAPAVSTETTASPADAGATGTTENN